MASKTALPIARLRALGCRVGTVIGHDPKIADFIYSVDLPERESRGLRAQYDAIRPTITQGSGNATAALASDGRVIVNACSYRTGQPIPDKTQRASNEADVAALLSKLADVLNGRKA